MAEGEGGGQDPAGIELRVDVALALAARDQVGEGGEDRGVAVAVLLGRDRGLNQVQLERVGVEASSPPTWPRRPTVR